MSILTQEGYAHKVRRYMEMHPGRKCAVTRSADGVLHFVGISTVPELLAVYDSKVETDWLLQDAASIGLREHG
jgi:hypothetical protein